MTGQKPATAAKRQGVILICFGHHFTQSGVTLAGGAELRIDSHTYLKETAMVLCPVALISGCAKCPIFKPCPLKGVIGDYVKPDDSKATKETKKEGK